MPLASKLDFQKIPDERCPRIFWLEGFTIASVRACSNSSLGPGFNTSGDSPLQCVVWCSAKVFKV